MCDFKHLLHLNTDIQKPDLLFMFHSLKMFINDNRENLSANFKPENAKKMIYVSLTYRIVCIVQVLMLTLRMENCFDFALNFHFEKVN